MFWLNIFIFLIFAKTFITTSNCPKFACETLGKGECVKKSFDRMKNERLITVQSCENHKYKCQIDIDYNFSNQTDYSTNLCVPEEELSPRKAKYPGEPCDSITNCINGPCPGDGVCPSRLLGESCETHLDCSVRNYCDSETKLCTQVKNHNETCTSDYQCKNSHGCHNELCIDYFSLPIGTDLTNSTSDNPEKLCVTGIVEQGKCYALFYHTQMKPDKNGMVECNFKREDECIYTDSNNRTFTEQCQCGLNIEGKGFCRRAFDGKHGSDWHKLATRKRHILMNKCHTLNRFDCRNLRRIIKDRLLEMEMKTLYAHRLYYSEDCVKRVFTYSFSLEINILVFLIVILNYLI